MNINYVPFMLLAMTTAPGILFNLTADVNAASMSEIIPAAVEAAAGTTSILGAIFR